MSNLYFHFGNLVCRIVGDSRRIYYVEKCYQKSPFYRFISRKNPKNRVDCVLVLTTISNISTRIEMFQLTSDYNKREFILECAENTFFIFPVIEQVLRKIFYYLFFFHDGFILHASAIVLHGRAAIFLGQSGSGKSTIVKILARRRAIAIVADNNVYIRKIGKRFVLFPPAFLEWNLSRDITAEKMSLGVGGLYILHKNAPLSVQQLDFSRLSEALYNNIQIPKTSLTTKEQQKTRKLVFQFAGLLTKKKTGFSLHFSLNSSPVDLERMLAAHASIQGKKMIG